MNTTKTDLLPNDHEGCIESDLLEDFQGEPRIIGVNVC
jgi:hypothetical protein